MACRVFIHEIQTLLRIEYRLIIQWPTAPFLNFSQVQNPGEAIIFEQFLGLHLLCLYDLLVVCHRQHVIHSSYFVQFLLQFLNEKILFVENIFKFLLLSLHFSLQVLDRVTQLVNFLFDAIILSLNVEQVSVASIAILGTVALAVEAALVIILRTQIGDAHIVLFAEAIVVTHPASLDFIFTFTVHVQP